MPNHIYNVKQAAKILGLSTNTTYKYLNEGRIKAARGHVRGTFIITTKSLEDFLGGKLPENPFEDSNDSYTVSQSNNKDAETIIEVTPPTLTTKIIRVFISLALIITIIDILTSPSFSPLNQFGKVLFITLLILVSYQFGGFVKK